MWGSQTRVSILLRALHLRKVFITESCLTMLQVQLFDHRQYFDAIVRTNSTVGNAICLLLCFSVTTNRPVGLIVSQSIVLTWKRSNSSIFCVYQAQMALYNYFIADITSRISNVWTARKPLIKLLVCSLTQCDIDLCKMKTWENVHSCIIIWDIFRH